MEDAVDAATHFTLADGVYSAGLRNGVPEAVIREAIQLVSRLVDLRSPLQADQIHARPVRSAIFATRRSRPAKVIYVGLRGGGAAVDCYSFEGNDGFVSLLRSKAAASPKARINESRPFPRQ